MKHLWLFVLISVGLCTMVTPPEADSADVEAVVPSVASPSRVVLSEAARVAMKERSGKVLSIVYYGECGDRPMGISCETEAPSGADISQNSVRIVAALDVMEHLDELGPLVIDYDGTGSDGRFTVNFTKPLSSNDPVDCGTRSKKPLTPAPQKRLVLSDAARKALKTQPKMFWSVTYNGTCSGVPALGFYPQVEPLPDGIDVSQDGFQVLAEPKVFGLLSKMGPIMIGCTPAGKDYVYTAEFKNPDDMPDDVAAGNCEQKEPGK